MQNFTNGLDGSEREGEIRVASLETCPNHQFLTYASNCECDGVEPLKVFIVVGTDYGYIHTSLGSMRIWYSASGARKFIKTNMIGE